MINELMVVDDQPLAEVFAKGVKNLSVDMSDAILVGINSGEPKTARKGLDQAIEKKLVETGRPVILYSFEPRSFFNLDTRFHWLLGHVNCDFMQLPFGFEKLQETYENLRCRMDPDEEMLRDCPWTCQDDALCLSLLDVKIDIQTKKGTLKHDLKYAISDSSKLADWLVKARKIGYSGTDQEIVLAVEQDELPSEYRPYEGKVFGGNFIDLEGTMFDANGDLNLVARVWIRRYRVGNITLWTGGDLKDMAKRCRKANLPWKVLPKGLFRGATVERALDDQPQALLDTYGIVVRQSFDVNRYETFREGKSLHLRSKTSFAD